GCARLRLQCMPLPTPVGPGGADCRAAPASLSVLTLVREGLPLFPFRSRRRRRAVSTPQRHKCEGIHGCSFSRSLHFAVKPRVHARRSLRVGPAGFRLAPIGPTAAGGSDNGGLCESGYSGSTCTLP